MPRLNAASEFLVSLRNGLLTALIFRENTGTHGDTTTTAPIVNDDATIAVTAVTNFTDLDFIIIRGDGGDELNQINDGGAPASPLTLMRPAVVAQSTGATVAEATGLSLGHLTSAGITTSGSLPRTPVASSTSPTPLTTILGAGEFSLALGLQGYNILNYQFAHGAPEVEQGVGSVGDPYQGLVVGATAGTQPFQILRVQSVRDDGMIFEVDFNNFQVEVSGGPTFNRGADNAIPVNGKYSTAIARHWTPA